MNFIVIFMVLAALADGQSVKFSAERDLVPGSQPHCAIDQNGVLHIVYKVNTSIGYMTLDPAGNLSAPEPIPGTGDRDNPWICVTRDGKVHVVWDTWSEAWYTCKVGSGWTAPVTLPKEWVERNYFAQVTGGYNDEVYVSTWNLTKGVGDNNSYYKITLSNNTPLVTVLWRDPNGSNRPPSVAGPTAQALGDGSVHAVSGSPQSIYYSVSSTGAFSSGTNISRTPPSKTGEGMQAFLAGTDVGFVTHWWDGSSTTGVVVNTLSRAKAGKTGIVAGTGSGEFGYPRGAYDPVTQKAYILYVNNGRSAVTMWDTQTGALEQLGPLAQGIISGETRGPGAGGIAPVLDRGGVHVVYSVLNRLYYRAVNTQPLGIKEGAPVLNMNTGLKIFPNPFNAAGVLRLALPGFSGNSFYYVAVYDMAGRLKHAVTADRDMLTSGFGLRETGWTPGVYVISVRTPAGTLSGKFLLSE